MEMTLCKSRLFFRRSYQRLTPVTLCPTRCLSSTKVPQDRNNGGTFLHKVDDTQKMFIWGHRAGTRNSTNWYTLNSRKPLSYDVMQQAMLHLHRKCPVYQVVTREHEGEMWWYKPSHVDIDFKILEKGKPKFEAVNEIFSEGFDDTTGPLCKARLIPAEEDAYCELPEVKKDFPHQYYLLMTVHHAVMDLVTLGTLSQHNIDIINAVIEGDRIDDSAPFGLFVSDEEYQKAALTFKERLMNNPERLERIKSEVLRSDKMPTILKGFPRPEVDNPTTKHLYFSISADVLQKFAGKCKENGITIGTGLQAVTNTALIELVQEEGSNEDFYDVSVNLAVNLRRYMKEKHLPVYGMHARTMASVVTMDRHVRDNFWKNCRRIQDINSGLLKEGAVVEQNVTRQLCLPSTPAEEFYRTLPTVTRDYGYTNLGNFNRILPGTGKHVQMTSLEAYTLVHRFIYPFLLHLHTFRGSSTCSLCYATDWMTEETAKRLTKRFIEITTRYSQQ